MVCMAISHRVRRWQKLELVIKLLQPVSDAIHQLEADAPMLSQVTKVYATLLDRHVPAWVAALPGKQRALGEGVLDAFKARADKHLHPAHTAAWLLDPLHFSDAEPHHPRPPFEQLSEPERAECVALIARISGSSTDDVEKELEGLEYDAWPDSVRVASKALAATSAHPMPRRRKFWVKASSTLHATSKAAMKLLSMHATTGGRAQLERMGPGVSEQPQHAQDREGGEDGVCEGEHGAQAEHYGGGGVGHYGMRGRGVVVGCTAAKLWGLIMLH